MVYKESPLCPRPPPWDANLLSCCRPCFLKVLVPHLSVWAFLHFWRLVYGIWRQCFHHLVTGSASLAHQEGHPCQAPPDLLIQWEGASLPVNLLGPQEPMVQMKIGGRPADLLVNTGMTHLVVMQPMGPLSQRH
jgi:hypothetical protein